MTEKARIESNHPAPEELLAFAESKSGDAASMELLAHLEACEDCRRAVTAHQGNSHKRETFVLDETKQEPSVEEIGIDGYSIERELGRGGMGVVYEATQQDLKRSVALKVIISGEHASEEHRKRFMAEAETVAKLSHPGIVQIYDVGEASGRPYLALELVRGGSLGGYAQERPQPAQWSAAIVLQLARAIQYAHNKGVIHRDLKPDNVLLMREEHSSVMEGVPLAKVTDFGLAKQLDSAHDWTKTGMIMGTPEYMAPEQALGKSRSVGPAADVYALGAILYELVTGVPPFLGEDSYLIMRSVLEDDAMSPRQLVPDLPIDIDTICLKSLMKRPEDRYESAEALATDLELFLKGEPIRAQAMGTWGKLVRWARHKPLLATHYLACFLFLSLHLVQRYVFEAPNHKGLFHFLATGLFASWAVGATGLQRLLDNKKWRAVGEYGFALLPILAMTLMFPLDKGPMSGPVPVYLVLLAMSVLIAPHPRMVWTVTLFTAVCYSSLVAFGQFVRPEYAIGPERALSMILALFGMGLTLHLILRRAQPALRSEGSAFQ